MNYYDLLGVARTATTAAIKKAYRKLSMKYHPDREGGDKETFQKIKDAYECLSDDERREHYDRTGSDSAEPTTPDAVSVIMLELFTTIIRTRSAHTRSCMEQARAMVNSKLNDAHHEIRRLKSEIEIVEALGAAVSGPVGGTNLFEDAVLAEVNNRRRLIEQAEEAIIMLKEALERLKLYADHSPDGSAQAFKPTLRLDPGSVLWTGPRSPR